MQRTFLCLMMVSFFLSSPAKSDSSAFFEKTVLYGKPGAEFEGFLVTPKKGPPKMAVLVFHDWKGLTDRTKEKTRALARLGYAAFAADLYGKGIRPATNDEASKQAGVLKSDRKLFRDRALLSLQELKKIAARKYGVIGYCMGGTGALELARAGANVDAVVSFHGGLDSPDPSAGKHIRGKILVLHGADDPFSPPQDIEAFASEMKTAHVDWQMIQYGGAVHSFTDRSAGNDPSKGAAYNEKADRRSWEAMRTFFSETLAP